MNKFIITLLFLFSSQLGFTMDLSPSKQHKKEVFKFRNYKNINYYSQKKFQQTQIYYAFKNLKKIKKVPWPNGSINPATQYCNLTNGMARTWFSKTGAEISVCIYLDNSIVDTWSLLKQIKSI